MNGRTAAAMFAALAIPGAGHFLLGRRGRAVAFFVTVIFMFIMGLALDGKLYAWHPPGMLSMLATLASMGTGIPYFIARSAGTFGDLHSITYEYGTAFTLTAGLMNLLLVLDVFDIAQGRKQ